MKVWLVETGEYEQRDVFSVAASLEAAVQSVKDVYGGDQYRVTWDELTQNDWQKENDRWTLLGHFERTNYATQHTVYYDIAEWAVAGAE